MNGLIAAACAPLAFAVAFLTMRHAEALRLVQAPNHRSSHKAPTPSGGGLGIAAGGSAFGLWALASGAAEAGWIVALSLAFAALGLGEPILIRDLADNMIRLAGFTVRDEANQQGDIAIVVEGARPGEKLYEELFYDAATAAPTRHPKILRAKRQGMGSRDVPAGLADLRAALDSGDEARVRQLLFDFIADEEAAPPNGD